ncbi:MAG: hypothetical protein MUO75_02200 [Actinobacteria bacterium]|nr:hypothetical protein [Actinomycetota bacterium]
MAKARLKIICVSSSSKKAGKSSLASYLVRELGADFGLKVSSGGTHPTPETIITDPAIIEKKGTDTGSLVEAGARTVVWVNAEKSRLSEELERALLLFGGGGLLVAEGNSALEHLDPDLSVFLMAVPFDEFKSSAESALARSDLVLVDLTGPLSKYGRAGLASELEALSQGAEVLFYEDERDRELALREAASMARTRLGNSRFMPPL